MVVLTAVGVGDAVDDAVGTGVLRRSRSRQLLCFSRFKWDFGRGLHRRGWLVFGVLRERVVRRWQVGRSEVLRREQSPVTIATVGLVTDVQ